MVSIQLDPAYQKRLDELAKCQGQDAGELARRILVDFLDFQALPQDSDDAWAEASVALASEIMDQESWDEPDDGP